MTLLGRKCSKLNRCGFVHCIEVEGRSTCVTFAVKDFDQALSLVGVHLNYVWHVHWPCLIKPFWDASGTVENCCFVDLTLKSPPLC